MPTLPNPLRPLLTANAYPHPAGPVRLIETHVSWVFLTGEYAYKVKRPVRYAFIDLRSIGRRKFFCEEELRLNSRFAPDLYLDVCAVVAHDGLTRIGGSGHVVDYAVRMRQFDCAEVLDQLLAAGRVTARDLEEFGRDLARRLGELPLARPPMQWGSAEKVRGLLLENIAQCMQCFGPVGTQEELRALCEPYRALLDSLEPLLRVRRAQGRIHECHGDLHSRNVVRYQGRLLAFDCMEFEPAFRWIDVAEEAAFLLMDLHVQRAPRHAQAFLGGFLAQSGDYAACRLLRLYAIHRALVRAKVCALEVSAASDVAARAEAVARHRAYLAEIRRLLGLPRPRLLLMSGLSGSGKTWLASRLANELGAVHLRSDVERKRMAGMPETDRSGSGVGQELYSRAATARVMEYLLECATDVLDGGFTVIVDATFGLRDDRQRFLQLASGRGIGIHVIHCHAPRAVLESRIRGRQQAGLDASDADLEVLAWQESHREDIAPDEGLAVIDADTTDTNIVSRICASLAPAAA